MRREQVTKCFCIQICHPISLQLSHSIDSPVKEYPLIFCLLAIYVIEEDDKARASARKYFFVSGEDEVIDPTNKAGLLDLELSFLGGLVKVHCDYIPP